MKKTTWFVCALVLALLAWPAPHTRAAQRCYPNKRFVVLEGNLVADTLTNRVWQQQISSTTMSWTAAKTYCPAGFRLPTLKELSSIVDFTVTSPPAIDRTAFPNTPPELFWSSTPLAGSNVGWMIRFDSGYTIYDNSGGGASCWVRCVR